MKLLPPQLVKPYVKRGKNDAADAEALCEAMSRPTMRFAPVKSEERQAALMLVGMRDRLVRARTQLSNAIRGYAAEFGEVAAKGLDKIEPLLTRVATDERLPALARELFAAQAEEYAQLQVRIDEVDAKLTAWRRKDALGRRLAGIPGVGPVVASLLSMKTPDPGLFRSGRQFAAWIGLTPKDHSTAGKVRRGGITRAGDEALRSGLERFPIMRYRMIDKKSLHNQKAGANSGRKSLATFSEFALVVGATAVIRQVRRSGRGSPWLLGLLSRKEPKHAAVALANKIARIAWKLMVTGEAYDARRAAPAA